MQTDTVKVWDPLVRIFHWSLALAIAVAYFSGDDHEGSMGLHPYAGYVIAGLVAFRLVWGVVGTRHARFGDFVTRPSRVVEYLKQLGRMQAPRYLGHNPAGGAMIVVLLLMLAATATTGMLAYGAAEHAGGPFAAYLAGSSHSFAHSLKEVHEFFANFTLFLVGIHIVGVIVESLVHRENLARAMVTGKKRP